MHWCPIANMSNTIEGDIDFLGVLTLTIDIALLLRKRIQKVLEMQMHL